MKKRTVFYFLQSIAIFIIIYISFFLYWRQFNRTTSFFVERIGNVLLIFFLIMFLSNLFDLVTYKRFINKDFDFARELFLILGRVFIIILIVSFIEFFIFFKTKIGRIIYVNLYFLLSLFFVIESILINVLIGSKKQRILWLSSIPFLQVKKEYLLDIGQIEVSEFKNEPNNKNGYDYTIYDYPPTTHKNIHHLLHTIISIKNPIDLVTYIEETIERIPLNYVDEVWLLKNIRTFETIYDKLRRIFNFFSSLILLILLFLML